MNFSSLNQDTENNANFDVVSSKRGNLTPFSKKDKTFIKHLCESEGYNARQLDKEQHQW